MITSLIYWIVKLVLGVLAVIFGFIIGLVLIGISLPTGLYYQLGKLCSFINKKVNNG